MKPRSWPICWPIIVLPSAPTIRLCSKIGRIAHAGTVSQIVFAGELEPPDIFTPDRDNLVNWLHMEIVIPPFELTRAQAELETRSKRFYGVGRETIVSVLYTSDALPGKAEQWSELIDPRGRIRRPDEAPRVLAAIPFREFADRGRLAFEALVIPRGKLTAWLEAQGERLPAFLADKPRTSGSATVTPVIGEDTVTRPPGRPHKPAWPRIVQLVRELRDANPEWQKKRQAYEAWQLARREFSEAELPWSRRSSEAWWRSWAEGPDSRTA